MDAELGPWARRGVGFGLGLLFVVALVAGLIAGMKVAAMVLIAVLLASALGPPVDAVRSRAPFGRTAATGVLFLALGGLLVALVVVLATTAASQVDEIGARIPALVGTARAEIAQIGPPPLATAMRGLLDDIDRSLRSGPQPTPDQVLLAGSTVLDILGGVASVATLMFFWLHERARIQRFTLAFVPMERRMGVRQAWNDVEDRLGHWVRAQLTLMVLMGASTGLAYTLLGLPASFVLGLAAGLFEAVPIVGPILGAIPAVLVAATVRPDLLPVVVAVYVVVQLAESNIVVPIVMRNTVGLSPFIVLVSVLLGATLGGMFGAFLAIPIAASAEVIVERLQLRERPVGLEPAASDAPALDMRPASSGA